MNRHKLIVSTVIAITQIYQPLCWNLSLFVMSLFPETTKLPVNPTFFFLYFFTLKYTSSCSCVPSDRPQACHVGFSSGIYTVYIRTCRCINTVCVCVAATSSRVLLRPTCIMLHCSWEAHWSPATTVLHSALSTILLTLNNAAGHCAETSPFPTQPYTVRPTAAHISRFPQAFLSPGATSSGAAFKGPALQKHNQRLWTTAASDVCF